VPALAALSDVRSWRLPLLAAHARQRNALSGIVPKNRHDQRNYRHPSTFYMPSLVMEANMLPEERRKELANSEEEMWRVLAILGMSRETIERSMAFKNSQPPQEEPPLPARKAIGRLRNGRPG
jgi:hypothetical protein